jgi:hypothetical protein
MVYAARNTMTNEIVAWNVYMDEIGLAEGDPEHMYRAKGWDTFRGSCALLAKKSWARNDENFVGSSQDNKFWYLLDPVVLRLDISIPPFQCTTGLTWWAAQFGDNIQLRLNFVNQLRGLDDKLWFPWRVGLFLDQLTYLHVTHEFTIPECSDAWLSGTTVRRHVEAVPVFDIQQYNIFKDGSWVESTSWMDFGDRWTSVFTLWSTIECHAATAQVPDGPLAHGQPLVEKLPESECP